jgi:signal transduction histidine kinase
MQFINFLFQPKSTTPNDIFRERLIRILIVIPVILFSIFAITSLISDGITALWIIWNGLLYGVAVGVFIALHYREIDVASRVFMLAMGLIVIDNTNFYWSPGTIVFGLMFTFIFQTIMSNQRDIIIAVSINLSIYTLLVFFPAQPSPLHPNDYFSSPIGALITVYAVHFMIISVTHFIRREQRLRDQMELLIEQQRVDILRQFLGHSSHDLRTLLTRVSSNVYLMKRKQQDADTSSIERLEGSIGDLEKLVLSMLEMARLDDISHFELMSMDIDELLTDIVHGYRLQAEEKSQTMDLITATDNSSVQVDLQYFTRAIGNILENAVNYSPENSNITITSSRQHNKIIITIQDNGIGILPEQLPYIFDSFYRGDVARNQSTGLNGLGLAISKKTITAHGGTLSVESEIEMGSTFSVTLPIA